MVLESQGMKICKLKSQKAERSHKFIEELRLDPDMLSSFLDHIEKIRRTAKKREKQNQSD